MKKAMRFFSLILLCITMTFVHAQAQNGPDAILGKWTNEDKTRVIEFVKTGSNYNALIREAPDRGVIGKDQLTNLSFREGSYKGNVQLPKKGKSYPCTLRIKTDGSMELTAKAGFMSKTQIWTRVK